MLLNLLRNNALDWNTKLPLALLSVIVILISLTVHELSHGYIAYKCGDPTARNLGRLTLNPVKHLDPVGAVCMLLFGFGWAKPVPVNSRYFKNPKRGMALTALAGPVSNFLLAFIALFFYLLTTSLAHPASEFAYNAVSILAYFFYYFALINLSFGVFNLFPVPPLDGSRILFIFLPTKYYFGIMKYERYIAIAFLLLLWSGMITTPLSYIVGWIEGGMTWLIRLLPFIK